MKTTKFFLMAALVLTFAACSNDNYDAAQPAKGEGIPFTATISIGDGATTRALSESGTKLVASWAEGEKVALIHNSVSDEMTVSAVNDGKATITGTITGSPSNGDAVTVIYPSTAADGTTGNVKADLLYAQEGGTLSDVASKYDVRKGTGTLKVSGTASLDGNVSLANQFAIFKFTTKNADGSTTIDVKPLTITIGEQAYVITPSDATNTLYAALPEVSSQKVRFSATGSDSKTYAFSKDNVSFTKGKFYQSTLKMTEVVPEAVDLGLPSGTLWANMNVGAARESDFGKYFAWGETTGYDSSDGRSFGWANYSLCNGSQTTMTKYCNKEGYGTVDNKTTLEAADDAATANWGSPWRMPTKAEMQELVDTQNNTTDYIWELTTVDGHKGYRITRKSTGANIFLPASGNYGSSLYDLNYYGYYWSSSLDEESDSNPSNSYYLGTNNTKAGVYNWNSRYLGLSVRPVQGAATPAPEEDFVEFTYGTNTVNVAKMNLGATTVAESAATCYGNYYAWAATTTSEIYNAEHAPYYESYSYSKYTSPDMGGDGKTKLEAMDDAAAVNMPGWHMPTLEELETLFMACGGSENPTGTISSDQAYPTTTGIYWVTGATSPVTIGSDTYKVNGMLFVQQDGDTNNHVFFPAAGAYNGTTLTDAGTNGNYWSSNLYVEQYLNERALSLYFGTNESVWPNARNYRPVGFTVRPFKD